VTCPQERKHNDHGNADGMIANQFSLRSLFIATAFVAFACAAARLFITAVGLDLFALMAIPILLCGAFGVLRGRLRFWLGYGVAIDVAVMGLILLSLLR
jgi:hypothetical protein